MRCVGPVLRQARVRLLQSMPIFGGIGRQALEFLIDRASMRHVGSGEYFFHEGDDATSMFVIERGRAVVSKLWNGKPHSIRYC